VTTTTHDNVRIAWLGPAPTDVGGVPSMARQMLLGLADSGADLEIFLDSPRTDFLDRLAERPNVGITAFSTRWRYDRWYSSSAATALVSGTAARVHVGAKLAQRVAERHEARPFDVVYRLSQIELLALRRVRRQLPPIVLHPEVHAHGELRHHWRERSLALGGEPRTSFALNHAYLGYRSLMQRRDVRDVALMIAPSERFGDFLADDYAFPRERIRVIPNVVDLDRFFPSPVPPAPSPVRLLFVSRMSVRKGVDQIVALSHRIRDLAGRVEISCVGGASLFSNYSALLDDLDPTVARYVGQVPTAELPDLYRSAHGLLQPSLYEPFAITVAEALASGLPVVVSDEVGAREGVDPRVCRTHAAGDVAGLEREVRRLVDEVEAGWDPELRAVARRHAEANLSRDRFARALLAVVAGMRPVAVGREGA
jgi:glycosyltransferase involved in cell wall biosynthesis